MKNLKDLGKRALTLLMVLSLCLGTMQLTAFAEEEGTPLEKSVQDIVDQAVSDAVKAGKNAEDGGSDSDAAIEDSIEKSEDLNSLFDGAVDEERSEEVDGQVGAAKKALEDLAGKYVKDGETSLAEAMSKIGGNAAEAAGEADDLASDIGGNNSAIDDIESGIEDLISGLENAGAADPDDPSEEKSPLEEYADAVAGAVDDAREEAKAALDSAQELAEDLEGMGGSQLDAGAYQELEDRYNEVKEAVEASAENVEKAGSAYEEARKTVDELAERLQKLLEESERLDAASESLAKRKQALEAQLEDAMAILSAAKKDFSDAMKTQEEAEECLARIQGNLETGKDAAEEVTAFLERLKEAAAKEAKAQLARDQAEDAFNEANVNYTDALDKYNAAQGIYSEAKEVYDAATTNLNSALEDYQRVRDRYDAAMKELEEIQDDYIREKNKVDEAKATNAPDAKELAENFYGEGGLFIRHQNAIKEFNETKALLFDPENEEGFGDLLKKRNDAQQAFNEAKTRLFGSDGSGGLLKERDDALKAFNEAKAHLYGTPDGDEGIWGAYQAAKAAYNNAHGNTAGLLSGNLLEEIQDALNSGATLKYVEEKLEAVRSAQEKVSEADGARKEAQALVDSLREKLRELEVKNTSAVKETAEELEKQLKAAQAALKEKEADLLLAKSAQEEAAKQLAEATTVWESITKVIDDYAPPVYTTEDAGTDADPDDFDEPDSTPNSSPGSSANNTLITLEDEAVPLAALPAVFADVSDEDWFSDAVKFVVGAGLMKGTDEGTFAPDNNVTRAAFAAILHRMENEPAAELASFLDVAADAWFAGAAAWSSANGIIDGSSDTEFGAGALLTREQIAVILYRYAQYKSYDVSDSCDITAFVDGASISDGFSEGMAWCVAAGILSDDGSNALNPTGYVTRGEIAVMLMRFCQKYTSEA